MGRTIAQTDDLIDEFCVKLLVNGQEATALAYDEAPFFDDGTNRSFSNVLAGKGVTASNLESDIGDVMELYANMRTDKGNKIEIKPNNILCSLPLYLKFAKILKSPTTSDQANANVINILREFGLTIDWTHKLSGNTWYMMTNDLGMRPTYWQTTRIQGSRVILDVDETHLASEGWYGIAASLYGIGDYGLPFTCVRVNNA